MTIEDSDVIDGLGLAKDTRKAVLMISDHLSWKNEAHHFRLIEKKIGKYLDFVKSGQLLESLPQARNRPVQILIVFQSPPTGLALTFIDTAKNQLKSLGIELSYGPLPEGF